MKSFGENCIINCPNLAEICFDGCDLTTSPMGLMMNVAPKLTVRVPEGMSEENRNHAQKCVSWNSSPVEVTVEHRSLLPRAARSAGCDRAAA